MKFLTSETLVNTRFVKPKKCQFPSVLIFILYMVFIVFYNHYI
nr:MAG TPA: hypothetical protein [Caudoviricetes sp.]